MDDDEEMQWALEESLRIETLTTWDSVEGPDPAGRQDPKKEESWLEDRKILQQQNEELEECLAVDRSKKRKRTRSQSEEEKGKDELEFEFVPSSPEPEKRRKLTPKRDEELFTLLERFSEIDSQLGLGLFIRKPDRKPTLPHPLVLRFFLKYTLKIEPREGENSFLENVKLLVSKFEKDLPIRAYALRADLQ
jgi:hypothetical protein